MTPMHRALGTLALPDEVPAALAIALRGAGRTATNRIACAAHGMSLA